jgi:hypothetical protein
MFSKVSFDLTSSVIHNLNLGDTSPFFLPIITRIRVRIVRLRCSLLIFFSVVMDLTSYSPFGFKSNKIHGRLLFVTS